MPTDRGKTKKCPWCEVGDCSPRGTDWRKESRGVYRRMKKWTCNTCGHTHFTKLEG